MPNVRIDISSSTTGANLSAGGNITDQVVLDKLKDVLEYLQSAAYTTPIPE